MFIKEETRVNEKKLTLDEMISAIVQKVRKIYKYYPDYAGIVLKKATVTLRESQNGEFEIQCIEFNNYCSITVYDDAIWFSPEHGQSKKLMTYPSLEEFFKM